MYATLLLVAHSIFLSWLFTKAGYDLHNPKTRVVFVQLALLEALMFMGYVRAWANGV